MLQRLIERFFPSRPAEPSVSSPYQEAIAAYRAMVSPGPAVYQDITRITVILPTLDRYLELIGKALVALESNTLYVPPTLSLHVVRRWEFYLTQEGQYSDPDIDFPVFIQAICDLLSLYERRNDESQQSGLLQANLYRILPVINNLISLSEDLTS